MALNDIGRWGAVFPLKNVPVHASLLYTGEVLYWGRRSNPKDNDPKSLDVPAATGTYSYLWNPTKTRDPAAQSDQVSRAVSKSPASLGQDVNLFCSGHCFDADGNLFVVGGHTTDSHGINQACIFDVVHSEWVEKKVTNAGRWYPSVRTLPDGRVFCISGSQEDTNTNPNSQIWHNGSWFPVLAFPDKVLPLYPKLHLDPKGNIFMSGPQEQSYIHDFSANGGLGGWTQVGKPREAGWREYGPSVTYDDGQIIFIGGGAKPPTNIAEFIDLTANPPQWTRADMTYARQQHNATVLADGKVLVTGGTKGYDFNNLSLNGPVHVPELWDPRTKKWAMMATESVDRCYHSIALLLPDATVLSAGGGEYGGAIEITQKIDGKDVIVQWNRCEANAQIFEPPYLFNGPRPKIERVDTEITYGQKFEVKVAANEETKKITEIRYGQVFEVKVGGEDKIEKISCVRLGSVTHCSNMNQSLTFLDMLPQRGKGLKISVRAPLNANSTPPGHYMLFALSDQGVPSIAHIIKIINQPNKPPSADMHQRLVEEHVPVSLEAIHEENAANQARPAVAVGLTPICPYGLGPCFAGGYQALQRINDIDVVQPLPDHAESIAYVYLKDDILPDIDIWRTEFDKAAHGTSYVIRGIEMTLSGLVSKKKLGAGENQQLSLAGTSTRPELLLDPFQQDSKIEWDHKAQISRPMSEDEANAYARLSETVANSGGMAVQVTGRLEKDSTNKFSLHVRNFEVLDNATASA